ncbi:MAG: nucleotidyltransferase family protein [Syntrophomonas sp.]
MNSWRNVLTNPGTSIIEAIKILNSSAIQILLVVDEDGRLMGTVTDGDIRRGILKGLDLEQSVCQVMNTKPQVVTVEEGREKAVAILKNSTLHHIPIIDENRRVAGLEIIHEIVSPPQHDNRVVIMAGGLGSRLRPLTAAYPKPLLNVGGKPVLETILGSFIEQGFRYFYISINYKGEMIKNYFGSGSAWNVDIEYLEEPQPLGTAGSLGLISPPPEQPLLVMNGDILTKIDFNELLNFHLQNRVEATMCVRAHSMKIPYGVVSVSQQRLDGIDEKPRQQFLVNAGIYVLNPAVLKIVPHGSFFDMNELFLSLIRNQKEAAVFPIREYWIDIGRIEEYERANIDFAGFSPAE